MKNLDAFQIRDYVRERYGALAEQDDASARSGCGCGDSASGGCCSASAPAKPSACCVADATVDLIISNCVINLSPEKAQVFREAFRVLKPGGRLAISDVVATKPVPPALREKLQAIGACVAGAALISDLKAMLQDAGFGRIEIQPRNSSHQTIAQWTEDAGVADFVVSAYLTAYKS